jgi:hypothetical protein
LFEQDPGSWPATARRLAIFGTEDRPWLAQWPQAQPVGLRRATKRYGLATQRDSTNRMRMRESLPVRRGPPTLARRPTQSHRLNLPEALRVLSPASPATERWPTAQRLLREALGEPPSAMQAGAFGLPARMTPAPSKGSVAHERNRAAGPCARFALAFGRALPPGAAEVMRGRARRTREPRPAATAVTHPNAQRMQSQESEGSLHGAAGIAMATPPHGHLNLAACPGN